MTTYFPVQTPSAGMNTGQVKIATTGTAVQLPFIVLVNGITVKAKNANTSDIIVGSSNVTNIEDGTGNGLILEPGAIAGFAVTNANLVWVNGTAGSIVSYSGN